MCYRNMFQLRRVIIRLFLNIQPDDDSPELKHVAVTH